MAGGSAPIVVGDYVTTSSTAGKGTKATRAGRVVGMALEEFSGTAGQVMVQIVNTWYEPGILTVLASGKVGIGQIPVLSLPKGTPAPPSTLRLRSGQAPTGTASSPIASPWRPAASRSPATPLSPAM